MQIVLHCNDRVCRRRQMSWSPRDSNVGGAGPFVVNRKLIKFLIMFDNSNLLFFPGQFLSGRVIVEVEEDMAVLGTYYLYGVYVKA